MYFAKIHAARINSIAHPLAFDKHCVTNNLSLASSFPVEILLFMFVTLENSLMYFYKKRFSMHPVCVLHT